MVPPNTTSVMSNAWIDGLGVLLSNSLTNIPLQRIMSGQIGMKANSCSC